jgi:polyhydroxyalkanoate synthesis regulator protein
MQGMMGDYLEKNIQAFTEIQSTLQESSKKLVDGKGGFPNAEAWTQFMQGQAPMMQNLMGNYIEQSKSVFMQMQDQMQKNAQSMFQGFPFHGQAGAPEKKDN